ncbi:MAG: cobyrinate a,c-diamide synthase [Deltaproteobacteria bacterium]|nr:cobyrinate a,c-diamide synthase [Deltaproteobacteria bacterium]
MNFPGTVVAALRGGSGKTVMSVGIIAAWKKLGKKVVPFKKGPDYIDAGWLALAAGRPCYNLDTFLIHQNKVLSSFQSHIQKNDLAVIEGNRGLFDGIDTKGSTSTAELAKLLKLPVILCVDCTKSTRTMAAVVLGCIQFDPKVKIKGAILNRIAGARHENILRKSIEEHCGIPALGAVPKLKELNFPERHMGLVPTHEHAWAQESIAAMAKIAEKYIDLETIENIARTESLYNQEKIEQSQASVSVLSDEDSNENRPKIGIVKDSAFQFYYPENIDALHLAGADIVFISPLSSDKIPQVDALYIGGGFPETHAEVLAENKGFRKELKSLAEDGLPIYAECGGLMFLGEELILDEKVYPMAGVFPVIFGFSKKPQGHGYTVVEVENKNPYFKIGTEIRGHEFHYSKVLKWDGDDSDLVFVMKKGKGFKDQRDGLCYKNVFATYTHIHALGTPEWAKSFVRAAVLYKAKKKGQAS